MKCFISLSVLLLSTISSIAQVSVGFRSGVSRYFSTMGNVNSPKYWEEFPETHLDKEIFARYSVKHFSFELDINYDRQNINYRDEYKMGMVKGIMNTYTFSAIAQYRINTFGKNKKVKNYLGLSLSPQLIVNKYKVYPDSGPGINESLITNKSRDMQMWPGLHQTIIWDVNSHLQLSSQLFFKMLPSGNFTIGLAEKNNACAGLQIGAGYTL